MYILCLRALQALNLFRIYDSPPFQKLYIVTCLFYNLFVLRKRAYNDGMLINCLSVANDWVLAIAIENILLLIPSRLFPQSPNPNSDASLSINQFIISTLLQMEMICTITLVYITMKFVCLKTQSNKKRPFLFNASKDKLLQTLWVPVIC